MVTDAATRVLIVDDERDLCQLLRKYLQRQGYEVEIAGSGEEAWQAVQKNPGRFQAYLLDLSLPDMPGDELARRVLALQPSARILLSSGYAFDAARLGGNVAFLRKPFPPRELLEALGNLLMAEGR